MELIKEIKTNENRFFQGNKGIPYNVVSVPNVVTCPDGVNYQNGVNLFSDGRYLSTRANNYPIFQNSRFNNFCREIERETGRTIDFIGDFKGGKRQLAGFQKSNEVLKIGDFEFQDNLIVINSHDGSQGLSFGFSNVLNRCSNQFRATNKVFTVKHYGDFEYKFNELRGKIIAAIQQMKANIPIYEGLMKIKFTEKDFVNLEKSLFFPKLEKEDISTTTKNTLQRFNLSKEIEKKSLGQLNGFTAWNVVTHYTTHNMFVNDELNTAENTLPVFNNNSQKLQNTANEYLFNMGIEQGIYKKQGKKVVLAA